MSVSVFGAFLTSWQLEQATIAHLQEWMPDYLPYVEREAIEILGRDIPPLDPVASYTVVPREPDQWEQLPAILIVSPGVDGMPKEDGGGRYRATFNLGIGAICSTGEEDTSKLFADLYFTAASMIVMDKPSLGGFAEGSQMETMENDWLSPDRNRTLAATFGNFKVRVAGIRTVTGGPSAHLEDPGTDPGNFPEADTTDLEVSKVS